MPIRPTSSFLAKIVAAAGLVLLADRLFWVGGDFGSNLGWFALAWAAVTVLLTRAIWRNRGARCAAAAAIGMALVLADNPGPIAVLLFGAFLAVAALLPRHAGFDHVGRWALRLMVHGIVSLVGPWRDAFRLRRTGRHAARMRGLLPLLPLPLTGGAVFLGLFASANPLIGDALARIGMPAIEPATFGRILFALLMLTIVWATLRPRRTAIRMSLDGPALPAALPGVSIGSVLLALLLFNGLFALQNGLDLAFLWSNATLPEGVTLADYAHRGAYPLIATALLAGLFVLVTLRPGSDTAAVPAIRRLVILWVVQNVFLVASSMLRTLDYIQVYSLTVLRIAALLWMVLVALGLVLILWRMLRGRSAAWLINANAAAAFVALAGGSVVDLGAVAAAWNVRHAREAGGQGAALDLCYLNRLGASALIPLAELEQRTDLPGEFRERLAWIRATTLTATLEQQQTGAWTWRNARRLAHLDRVDLPAPPAPGAYGRTCDGTLRSPPPEPFAPPSPMPPLTNEARQ